MQLISLVIVSMIGISRFIQCRGLLVNRAFLARGTTSRILSIRTHSRLFSSAVPADENSGNTGLSAEEDASAVSKSRAPFAMPKNSPDDSVSAPGQGAKKTWGSLGLWQSATDKLETELELKSPTPVQIQAIPALLHNPKQPLCFLAATGSGKTLAYTLPLLQLVKQTEALSSDGEDRPKRRPRLVILAPTRELVMQITAVVKQLCHAYKLSSTALMGGSKTYGRQTKALDRPIDVVVATPSRLLQHWKDQHIYLGNLEHVVLDEMDTMLEQGFSSELQALLYPVLYRKQALQKDVDPIKDLHEGSPRMVLTSATMTQSILKSIGGKNKNDSAGLDVRAKKLYAAKDKSSTTPALLLPQMDVLKAPGLHKTVPRLQQVFIDVGASDKLNLLVDLVMTTSSDRAMIFCNTAAACRAVQFALADVVSDSTNRLFAYHGELNSSVRTENLQAFRKTENSILICTDLAARGLDIPQVDHVILFDFPLNAADYLHRTGRTARQGRPGRLTALVAKRDQVLANAIERAVQKGEPVDGLSSRKSDYNPSTRQGSGKGGKYNAGQRKGRPSSKKPATRRSGGRRR